MKFAPINHNTAGSVDPLAYDLAIERGKPFFDTELHGGPPSTRYPYFPAVVAQCGTAMPHILEVGTWIGASLAAWDEAARGQAWFTVVDLWKPYATDTGTIYEFNRAAADNGSVFRMFMHNIKALGMDTRVSIVQGDSREVLPTLKGTFDIAFIDGDHRYEYAKADIENCMKLVKVGGILCGDDCELQVADSYNDPRGIDIAVAKNVDVAAFMPDGTDEWHYYHPGVTRALFDCFGRRVSCYDGLWIVRKTADGWEDVAL